MPKYDDNKMLPFFYSNNNNSNSNNYCNRLHDTALNCIVFGLIFAYWLKSIGSIK